MLGKLEPIEMGAGEEEPPLVADLSFFSIRSTSLLLPIVASAAILLASFFMPPLFVKIVSKHTVELGRTGGFVLETELTDISPTFHLVSLALTFNQSLTAPCRALLSVSQYAPSSLTPYRIQSTEHRATHQTLGLFQTRFVNSSRLTATLSFPVAPTAGSVNVSWSFPNLRAFNFLTSLRISLAVLTIPAVTSVRRQLAKIRYTSLRSPQKFSFALLFLSLIAQIPLAAFLSDPIATIADAVIGDAVFAAMAAHALFMLLPFAMPDCASTAWGYGPPLLLFAGTAVLSLLHHAREPLTRFFPDLTAPRPFYVRLALSAALLLFCGFGLASAARTPPSKWPRAVYFLLLGIVGFIGATVYLLLPSFGFEVEETTPYLALPWVWLFLYTNLMFHGSQDTDPASAFTALDGGEYPRDTSMGIDLNDPLPLGTADADGR
jgi:hypothetical protein